MASCWAKGCLYSAVKGSNYCEQHRKQEQTAGRAAAQIPPAAAAEDDREFEIVKLDTLPAFRIFNQHAYKIAQAVKTLAPEHALKIKVETKKKGAALGVTVVNYCKKMQLEVKYRTSPDCVWIWKPESKKGGTK